MLYYVFDNRDRLEEVIEVSRMTLDDPVIADRIQSGWDLCGGRRPRAVGAGFFAAAWHVFDRRR
jgi:hypothetical protein